MPAHLVCTVSTDTYNPRRPSCLRRLLGTLTALVLAAAFVYAAAFLIIFKLLAPPAHNESGWLGPTMRLLATTEFQDVGKANNYDGDTTIYEIFSPLNKLWLRFQDLPDERSLAAPVELDGGKSPGNGRSGESGQSGDRAEGGSERTSASADRTTSTAEHSRRGRRGAGRATSGNRSSDGNSDNPQPRRRRNGNSEN